MQIPDKLIMMDSSDQKSGYGKRPLWQYILLYIFIAAVLYGLVYYFLTMKKGGYNYQGTSMQNQQSVQQASGSNFSNTTSPNSVYQVKSNAGSGNYITNTKGMTLYTFDKDTNGVSNCYNSCAELWPPYMVGNTVEKQLPEHISKITRSDSSKQFAWNGMSLYYYAGDKAVGDVKGDGLNGIWHLVKP